MATKKTKPDSKQPRTTARSSTGRAAESSSPDWRVAVLERLRQIVQRAVPEAVEEVKWRKPSNGMRGVPVWSHHGILCTGETYKNCVKMTFAKGASLDDPAGLFNASLEGNTRRAIDFHEGDKIDAPALTALLRAAAGLQASPRPKSPPARARKPAKQR